jgi:hypothetical protein
MKKILFILLSALLFLSYSPLKIFAGYNSNTNIPSTYKNIGTPYDLVVDADNNIWYVDNQNYRVVKVDQSGNILREVGREGSDWGEFMSPLTSITIDNDGNLYVLSQNEIYKLDSNGAMIDKWELYGNDDNQLSVARGIKYDSVTDSILVSDWGNHKVVSYTPDGDYKFKIGGTQGSSNGNFDHPWSLTTDSTGKIYVVDGDNHRVQVFNKNGVYLFKFGTNGSGDGEFDFPKDVVVLSDGKIVVTSQNSQKIQVFNSSGTFLYSFGQLGTDEGEFDRPQYLAKDSSNNIYVTDSILKSIQKYSSTGTFISAIRNSSVANGKLTKPEDVAYDSLGNLYVLDNGAENARIQKLTNSGTYISTVLTQADLGLSVYHMRIASDLIYTTHGSGVKVWNLDGTLNFEFGTFGSGNGEFDQARGIGIDGSGNIYVSDYFNNRVQKFDSAGNFILSFGTVGTGDGQFNGPETVFVSTSNEIYVASEQRVQVFNTSGVFQKEIASSGNGLDQFATRVAGIAIDLDGNLHVAEIDRNRVLVFDNTDTYVESYGQLGGGTTQLNSPRGIVINPVTDELTVADLENHRVIQVSSGVRIYDLNPNADVTRDSDEQSLVNVYYDPTDPGMDSIESTLTFGEYIVSDFTVDLTTDRNWDPVNVAISPELNTSLIQNLNQTDAPGVSTTHNMYVPREDTQTSVLVCPNAPSLNEINFSCPGAYTLESGSPSLEQATVDGNEYWRILGVSTSSGAKSLLPATNFEIEVEGGITTDEDFNVTVTVVDVNGDTVENYTGTVSIEVNGNQEFEYTFQEGDLGTKTFINLITIPDGGNYTIGVRDIDNDQLEDTSSVFIVTDTNPEVNPTPTPTTTGIITDLIDEIIKDAQAEEVPPTEIIDDIVGGNGNIPTTTDKDITTETNDFKFNYWFLILPLILIIIFFFIKKTTDNNDSN